MSSASSVPEFISRTSPDAPVLCYRPHLLQRAAHWFRDAFPGDVFYAVKANTAPHILRDLWDAGITGFDVASPTEVETVARLLPGATLAYMHPVKNRNAITRAYNEFGVRRFVLDSADELAKILDATHDAQDLTLVVRLGVSNHGATLPLTGKFGANENEAPDLLRAARASAAQLGVSFHVGSQALEPTAWSTAMADVSHLIARAGVTVDIVDVGGGFPALYPGCALPPLSEYASRVDAAFEDMMVLESAQLWCEPGRALVADAESLLVRIDGTKPGALYLNDGGFGALYDAVNLGWKFPIRAIHSDATLADADAAPYTLYGPTCDSADKFPEAVMLPAGLSEGDYLEFGAVGAYGRALASQFNGFGTYDTVTVADTPFASAYQPGVAASTETRVIALKP